MATEAGVIEMEFRARLEQLEKDLAGGKAKAAKAGAEMGEAMEDKLGSKLDGAGKSLQARATKALVRAGTAAGVAGGAAALVGFAGALESEAAEADLVAALGLDGADAAKAGDIAGKLYAGNFGDSVAGAGDAVAAVLQGGLAGIEATSGEIESITGKVITFAGVFRQDMGESVAAVSAMLINGLVPDADTAMDQLTATMQQVPEILRGEILSALTEYSPFFAQLGIDGEHAMGALVRASAGGTVAIDKTGDALKELVIRAQDGSKLTSEALTGLGLDVDKIAGGFAAGGPAANAAMNDIIAALVRVDDPVRQTQLGVALLGTPFEDLGRDAIPTLQALTTGLGDTAGAAQKMVDTVGTTGAAKLETFKRSMEENVNKTMEKAVGLLSKLPAPVQDIAAGMVGFLPFLTPLIPLVGLLPAFGFGVTGAGAAAAGSSIGFFAAAAGLWAVLWPILAVIAVIALVAVAVYLVVKHWDTIKAKTGEAWDWVVAKTGQAWDWVTGKISAAVAAVVGFVAGLPGRAASALASLNGRIADLASAAMSSLKDRISSGISDAVDLARSLPGRVVSAIGSLGSLLWGAGADMVRGLINGIASMGSALWSSVTSFISRNIPGPVKRVLGIASPSKVAMDLMMDFGAGLEIGLRRAEAPLGRASADLAGNAVLRSSIAALTSSSSDLAGAGTYGRNLAPAAAGVTYIVHGSLVAQRELEDLGRRGSATAARYNGSAGFAA